MGWSGLCLHRHYSVYTVCTDISCFASYDVYIVYTYLRVLSWEDNVSVKNCDWMLNFSPRSFINVHTAEVTMSLCYTTCCAGFFTRYPSIGTDTQYRFHSMPGRLAPFLSKERHYVFERSTITQPQHDAVCDVTGRCFQKSNGASPPAFCFLDVFLRGEHLLSATENYSLYQYCSRPL